MNNFCGATTLNALEELVLAYREAKALTKAAPLRISASGDMLDRLIQESFARGLTPSFHPDGAAFGPALDVYLDRDLHDESFRIAVLR
jgi:hypothetical protein